MKRKELICALALALSLVLTAVTPAFSLFGSKEEKQETTVEEGATAVRDLTISTYQDVPYTAQFLAGEGQEGALTFSVATQPKHGAVVIDGDTFTYTPAAGRTGKDSFTYTAADEEGRVSAPALVDITVAKPKTAVTYADLSGSPACAAAIRLAELGVFTGSQVGDSYFFEPERTVTRGEFLAMAMETAGVEAGEVSLTGFADDAAIPTWAKGYASTAVKNGLLQGVSSESGAALAADAPITVGQAAVLLDRTLSVADVDLEAWYSGEESVPTWAAQAVANLESVSVLSAGSFGAETVDAPVTRADAAQMLAAASWLLEGEDSGLLDWLS